MTGRRSSRDSEEGRSRNKVREGRELRLKKEGCEEPQSLEYSRELPSFKGQGS
jgi:hypothetical protein